MCGVYDSIAMSSENKNIFNPVNFKIENHILKGIYVKLLDDPNIGELILDIFKKNPSHVAQIDAETSKRTSFAEMRDRSIRCGLWMRKQGIRPGDIVAICSGNHSDIYVPLLATLYVGATFTGWPDTISLKSARYFSKLTEPKLIFAKNSTVDTLAEATKLEGIDSTMVVFEKASDRNSLDDILEEQAEVEVESFKPQKIENPDTPAVIVFTSGTTCCSKGVVHSYQSVVNMSQTSISQSSKKISLIYQPIFHLAGINLVLGYIFNIATRVVHTKWNADDSCRFIQKYKVSRLIVSPMMLFELCKSATTNRQKLESLKTVYVFGTKLNSKILEDFRKISTQAAVAKLYGLTEAGGIVAVQTKQNHHNIGCVLPNTQIKIVDIVNQNILGANRPGEICIKKSTIMLGYYKNPEETNKVIDEEGWLHTGDKGYYNDSGEITIIGRYKEMITYGMFHLSPLDIEDVLLTHPAVSEVAVVPVPHEVDIEQPFAFVKKSSDVTEDELLELSSSLGDKWKLRAGVKFLDELPKLPSGKIDRQQLKRMAKIIFRERLA